MSHPPWTPDGNCGFLYRFSLGTSALLQGCNHSFRHERSSVPAVTQQTRKDKPLEISQSPALTTEMNLHVLKVAQNVHRYFSRKPEILHFHHHLKAARSSSALPPTASPSRGSLRGLLVSRSCFLCAARPRYHITAHMLMQQLHLPPTPNPPTPQPNPAQHHPRPFFSETPDNGVKQISVSIKSSSSFQPLEYVITARCSCPGNRPHPTTPH